MRLRPTISLTLALRLYLLSTSRQSGTLIDVKRGEKVKIKRTSTGRSGPKGTNSPPHQHNQPTCINNFQDLNKRQSGTRPRHFASVTILPSSTAIYRHQPLHLSATRYWSGIPYYQASSCQIACGVGYPYAVYSDLGLLRSLSNGIQK